MSNEYICKLYFPLKAFSSSAFEETLLEVPKMPSLKCLLPFLCGTYSSSINLLNDLNIIMSLGCLNLEYSNWNKRPEMTIVNWNRVI